MIYREQLDKLARKGCQNPNCKHDHEQIIYLHSRCHVEGQCDILVSPHVLKVMCGKCEEIICQIAIKEAKQFKRCHINAVIDVRYEADSGIVEIICNECKALLAGLEVKSVSED